MLTCDASWMIGAFVVGVVVGGVIAYFIGVAVTYIGDPDDE